MSNQLLNSVLTVGFPFDCETVFYNTIVRAYSGKEQAINHSQQDRKRFTIRAEALNRTEEAALLDFYNDHLGEYDSFLFLDPKFGFVARRIIGVGTGALRAFQLKDINDYYRKEIQSAPVDAKIWVDNALKTKVTHYNIDYTDSGVCTFTYYPANGKNIEAEFYFYRRVRFEAPLITSEISANNIGVEFTLLEVV